MFSPSGGKQTFHCGFLGAFVLCNRLNRPAGYFWPLLTADGKLDSAPK